MLFPRQLASSFSLLSKTELEPSSIELPDHDLIQQIGRGAYGNVWLVQNKTLGVLRAVKLVHRSQFDEDRPFQREFDGLRRYEPISRGHLNLIAILHVGGTRDFFFCVMELADNALAESAGVRIGYAPRTLRSELKLRGLLPLPEILQVATGIASALAHLHANGLVHRDVKPSNVIFVRGVPKLADIGLVTTIGDSRSCVGTEGYIPPEGSGSPSADCYALGKLLYELSTGHNRLDWPRPPSDLPTRPDREQLIELNAILHKACAPDPADRFRSADEMRGELELLRAGVSIRQKREREQRWSVSKKVLRIGAHFAELSAAASTALQKRLRDTDLHSENPEVNNLLERGHICALAATPERLRQSGRYFQQALQLHPDFIPAWVGLFRAALLELSTLPQPAESALPNLRLAATRLIELAPDSAENCMAESFLHCLEGRLPQAIAKILAATSRPALSRQTRAVVRALHGSYLLNIGQPDQALEQFRLSEREVPTCAIVQVYLGHPPFIRRDFSAAMAQYQRSVEFEPRQALGYFWKGRACQETGALARAIDEFEQSEIRAAENAAQVQEPGTAPDLQPIKNRHDQLRFAFRRSGPSGYWRQRLDHAQADAAANPHYLATLFARLGEMKRAYELLESACDQGKINGLAFDHCWDRNDARFRRVAAKWARA